jgi:DNA-binding LacI/PurR family transcriptional regulator
VSFIFTPVVDDEVIISYMTTTAVAKWGRENTYTFPCRISHLGVDNTIMESTTQAAIRTIREKAERSGFTLSDVAYAAGIDKAQVSRWSTGKVVPLYSAVINLQEACDALVEARLAQLQKESQA